ncbi:reverse transcriptase [Gossypium australe]|uniref:Reverse transcriptase n=1 Tax=Gossypium australe TaxID=47621 RepID=A0A5B6VJM9_9ROSI|nr:reverse transcriptase [Gossypium australe]
MRGTPIGKERFFITHLFFTDDCILFGDASNKGASMVRDVIRDYEMASGQRVNFDKSLIYFGANVDTNVKETIMNLLGVRVASNSEKYLGLPMMVGQKKTWAFANFIDRFRIRIEGWSLRYLSMEGKKVFVKSVLQAIPVYVMQCFALPKMLCRKLEGIMNNARDLITDGILWRIGNGASVNIWNDPWLPGAGNNRLSVQTINPNWTTVDQLIEAETNTWNKDLIYNFVNDDHATCIFSIPISEVKLEDMLVWKHEGIGEYSVKSGTLRVEVDCSLCKAAPEDSDHLLWSCSILQQVWASLQIKIAPNDRISNCKTRFVNTFSAADDQNKQLIAISL